MRRSPSETWMFSVVFWIRCSWLPCLTDWQVCCSRYVVQLQQNICHQNDCEHEWQSTFSPKRTWGSEQNFLRQDAYRQPDTLLDSTWYTKLAILNSTHRLTGNQRSWRNISVVCSRHLADSISLAAEFCTDCTCRISLSVTPQQRVAVIQASAAGLNVTELTITAAILIFILCWRYHITYVTLCFTSPP